MTGLHKMLFLLSNFRFMMGLFLKQMTTYFLGFLLFHLEFVSLCVQLPAWHFKKYSQKEEYAVLENEARVKKVGLLQDAAPIAPWGWRKSGKRDSSTK